MINNENSVLKRLNENFNSIPERSVETEIRDLIESQSFAVLATQGQGQPYTSLISFAITSDLKKIVFSTPHKTRKFTLLSQSNKVSILIDNRSIQPSIVTQISGVTLTGKTRIITNQSEFKKWSSLLIKNHPYLDSFVKSPTNALILVDINRYFYVRKFQEVVEWNPHQEL